MLAHYAAAMRGGMCQARGPGWAPLGWRTPFPLLAQGEWASRWGKEAQRAVTWFTAVVSLRP